MKTIAIMQPYLFPYIGYFQLLNATDIFVVYDNIQFTKKGWIHRNRILVNGKASYVTLPLKKDSDLLSIKNRCLSVSFDKEKHKLLRRIKETYRKAPFCNAVYPLIERCFNFTDFNLFNFVYNSICESAAFLGVTKTPIISSNISINHTLKAEDKVLAICNYLEAERYINPIGGVSLYSCEQFRQHGIDLKFLRPKTIPYKQFDQPFVPNLSIIDVLMFNSVEKIKSMLDEYVLIDTHDG